MSNDSTLQLIGIDWQCGLKRITQQQMLARMWGNRDSSTLLVGLQTSPTTMEISVVIPQKTGSGPTI